LSASINSLYRLKNSMIDKVDQKILNVLLENSRLSYRQIARKLDISVSTVINRMDKLEREGIIKKYTSMLDFEKLGYEVEVIIEINIPKAYMFKIEDTLIKDPNVHGIYSTAGEFDVLLMAKFKDRRQLTTFLKRLQGYEFVERTHTKLILKNFKEEQVKV